MSTTRDVYDQVWAEAMAPGVGGDGGASARVGCPTFKKRDGVGTVR
jgi:hypothetical protein